MKWLIFLCLMSIAISSLGQIKNNQKVSKQETIRQSRAWREVRQKWLNRYLDTTLASDNLLKQWSDEEWAYTGADYDSIYHRNRRVQSKSKNGDTMKCWVRIRYYEKKIAGKLYKDITAFHLCQIACKSSMLRIIQKNSYDNAGALIENEMLKDAEWLDWRPKDWMSYAAESICNWPQYLF